MAAKKRRIMDESFDFSQTVTRDEEPRRGPQNAKERFYEKLRMPLWLLDTILGLLTVALIVALVLGVLRGNAA